MTRGQRRAVRPCVEHDPRVSRRSFHRATDRRERTRARPVTLARRARRDVPNMRPDRRRHALDGDALRRRNAAPHAREPSSLARGRHRRRAAPVGSARPPVCALGDPDRGNPRSRELRRRRWSPSCVGRAAPSAPRPGPLTVGRARDRRGGRAVVSRRRSVDPCARARSALLAHTQSRSARTRRGRARPNPRDTARRRPVRAALCRTAFASQPVRATSTTGARALPAFSCSRPRREHWHDIEGMGHPTAVGARASQRQPDRPSTRRARRPDAAETRSSHRAALSVSANAVPGRECSPLRSSPRVRRPRRW